jgi:transcriptional regulator with XRE-family HTH domain
VSKVWTIGEKLRALRQHYAYTQLEVAQSLEITDALVSYWESNKRRPQLRELSKLAALFHVTVDELTNETPPVFRRLRDSKQNLDPEIIRIARQFDEEGIYGE